jgi:hypothetical protein
MVLKERNLPVMQIVAPVAGIQIKICYATSDEITLLDLHVERLLYSQTSLFCNKVIAS